MQNTKSVIEQESVCSADTSSGMSWAAILGGTAVAIAISFILLILGSALGLSSFSPWSYSSSDVADFTVKVAIWLIIMQWIASGLGGYITGRLRTKWIGMHTDEVFFRDTAHGFITWAVATIFTACFLASVTASVVSGGTHAAAGFFGSATKDAGESKAIGDKSGNNALDYYVDKTLRITPSANNAQNSAIADHEARMETARILLRGMKEDGVSGEDRQYLAQEISARAGISQADAEKRVDEIFGELNTLKAQAQEKAEAARKMGMKVSLYIFLSMLIGAFIASAAAAVGGRQRDEY